MQTTRDLSLSHDLNNLLTVVLSHAELMRDRVTDREDAKSLEIIVESVESAAEITGQIVAYAPPHES